jgi:hypothetical protein
MVGRTKADDERIDQLQQIGCIVTLLYFGFLGQPGDIHHLLNESGQRYEGELHT